MDIRTVPSHCGVLCANLHTSSDNNTIIDPHPQISGNRYRCTDCKQFNICEVCFNKHNNNMKLTVIWDMVHMNSHKFVLQNPPRNVEELKILPDFNNVAKLLLPAAQARNPLSYILMYHLINLNIIKTEEFCTFIEWVINYRPQWLISNLHYQILAKGASCLEAIPDDYKIGSKYYDSADDYDWNINPASKSNIYVQSSIYNPKSKLQTSPVVFHPDFYAAQFALHPILPLKIILQSLSLFDLPFEIVKLLIHTSWNLQTSYLQFLSNVNITGISNWKSTVTSLKDQIIKDWKSSMLYIPCEFLTELMTPYTIPIEIQTSLSLKLRQKDNQYRTNLLNEILVINPDILPHENRENSWGGMIMLHYSILFAEKSLGPDISLIKTILAKDPNVVKKTFNVTVRYPDPKNSSQEKLETFTLFPLQLATFVSSSEEVLKEIMNPFPDMITFNRPMNLLNIACLPPINLSDSSMKVVIDSYPFAVSKRTNPAMCNHLINFKLQLLVNTGQLDKENNIKVTQLDNVSNRIISNPLLPIQVICLQGSRATGKLISMLMDEKCFNAYVPDIDGRTPLHLACLSVCQVEVLETLIKAGGPELVLIEHFTESKLTGDPNLDIAPAAKLCIADLCTAKSINESALRFLLSVLKAITPERGDTIHKIEILIPLLIKILLHRESKGLNPATLNCYELLFNHYPGLITELENNKTSLFFLAVKVKCSLYIIEYLLKLYPQAIKYKTPTDSTAIHVVQQLDTLNLLLSLDKDMITAVTNDLSTALHTMMDKEPNLLCIERLLEVNPKLASMKTKKGILPIHNFLSGSIITPYLGEWDSNICKILCKVYPEAVKESAETKMAPIELLCSKSPLFFRTIKSGDIASTDETVFKQKLLKDQESCTKILEYLLEASPNYISDVVKNRLSKTSELDAKDYNNLLISAIDRYHSPEFIKLLIKNCPDLTKTYDNRGETPLLLSISRFINPELLEYPTLAKPARTGSELRVQTKILQILINADRSLLTRKNVKKPEYVPIQSLLTFRNEKILADINYFKEIMILFLKDNQLMLISPKPEYANAKIIPEHGYFVPIGRWREEIKLFQLLTSVIIAICPQVTNSDNNNINNNNNNDSPTKQILDWLFLYFLNPLAPSILSKDKTNTTKNNNEQESKERQQLFFQVLVDFSLKYSDLMRNNKILDKPILSLVAQTGNLEAIKCLVTAGASILATDKDNLIALDYCDKVLFKSCYTFLEQATKQLRMYRNRYEITGKTVYGGRHPVQFGIDTKSILKSTNKVALKFFQTEEEYLTELNGHKLCLQNDPQAKYSAALIEYFTDAKRTLPAIIKQSTYQEEAKNNNNNNTPSDSNQCLMEYCIVMESGSVDLSEYNNGGSVNISSAQLKVLLYSIIPILKHYYTNNIMHGDLKLKNMIVPYDNMSGGSSLKLIDFENVKKIGEIMSDETTPAYTTPELARFILKRMKMPEIQIKLRADHSYDIFSLGLLIYELRIGKCFFRADSSLEIFEQISTITDQQIERKITTNSKFTEEEKSLLTKLLKVENEERCDIDYILNHAIYKGGITDTVMKQSFQSISNKLTTINTTVDTMNNELKTGFAKLSDKADAQMRALLEVNVTDIPRLFLLVPDIKSINNNETQGARDKFKNLFNKIVDKVNLFDNYKLIFLCQGAGSNNIEITASIQCSHHPEPIHEGYTIKQPGQFLTKAAPIMRITNSLLKVASIAGKCVGIPIPYGIPLLGDILDSSLLQALDNFYMSSLSADQANLANTLSTMDSLDNQDFSTLTKEQQAKQKQVFGEAYTALKQLLTAQNIDYSKGGLGNLQKVIDKDTGQVLYVCDNHAKCFISPSSPTKQNSTNININTKQNNNNDVKSSDIKNDPKNHENNKNENNNINSTNKLMTYSSTVNNIADSVLDKLHSIESQLHQQMVLIATQQQTIENQLKEIRLVHKTSNNINNNNNENKDTSNTINGNHNNNNNNNNNINANNNNKSSNEDTKPVKKNFLSKFNCFVTTNQVRPSNI